VRNHPQKPLSQQPDPMHHWTTRDAAETYRVDAWGDGHFAVNDKGNLTVCHEQSSVDLKVLVDDLTRRGIQLPLLIRFPDLIKARIELLNGAFGNAIEEYGYRGTYRGVFPIKVNQVRKVVEAITRYGRPFHYGLEAGSKPELLAVMAMLDDDDALVICNGYKDENYVETALLASKLGSTVVIVVEKPSELDLIRKVSQQLRIAPTIGVRMKLSARGSGKWEQSGGDHAKFGLTASEIVGAVDKLREWDMLDRLTLLHFHLGSQITAIRSIKDALREASRTYIELSKLGCGLTHFDVGGGLGVDYDGSQSNFDSSMNYSVQEYANDVVWTLHETCEAEGIQHPTIVTEAGRAVAAHHSVLVVNVIGVTASTPPNEPEAPPDDAHDLARELWESYTTVSRKNVREHYHDVLELKDRVLSLFNLGHLSLSERARCESLFWACCSRMIEIAHHMPRVPEELRKIERRLCDTYFCNFSMFQSLPDSWAIGQLFPIMPIHRLDERPERRGVIADITCDSDGTIDAFIDVRDVNDTLALHSLTGDAYYLGIMLTGAYQEILGDLHNLFGDTNVVNISLGERYHVDEVVYGDTVEDVLRYVDYQSTALINALRTRIEKALRKERMSLDESRQLMQSYRDGMSSYTYLED
jgi:arginine decarboxylase